MTTLEKIKERYSHLAGETCSLSCGQAINYALVKEGETAVDLGSGRGQDVFKMAGTVGANGFVYGIDISEGMIEKAVENAQKFDIKNVSFLKSTLETLPLKDEQADVIISNCTINHAADKQAVWQEIHRVLKKGGRFVVSDIYASSKVPAEYANDPQAIAECWGGSVTKETYLEQLKKSGFENFTILEESPPYDKGKISVSSITIAGEK